MRFSRAYHSLALSLAMLVMLIIAPLTLAQSTTQPAGTSAFDAQAIKRTTRTADATEPTQTSMDWQRLAIAMTIVLGLIFGLKFLIGKMYPNLAASSKSGMVKVLSRSTIAPRQQVMLLQVGQRVIVVGDSGGQLSTLCNINEPDEVASLVGQLENQELQPPVKTPFLSMFGRARAEFDEPIPEPTSPAAEPLASTELDTAQNEISGLIDRMRTLTRVVRRDEQG